MENLLIWGYLRESEKCLCLQNVVPIEIYYICFEFYRIRKLIFYLAASVMRQDSDILSVINITNKNAERFDYVIYELIDGATKITIKDCAAPSPKWCIDRCGVAFAENIDLPPIINEQLTKNIKYNNFNNIIFRCGGMDCHQELNGSNYCGALILLNNINNISYNWKLPQLPYCTESNFVLYSYSKKSLFSIGGNWSDAGIYKLSFNDYPYDLKQWKWKKLDIENKKINKINRIGVSCVIIDNLNKLICIGDKCELFDFNTNEWDTKCMMNHCNDNDRMYAAIYHHKSYNQSIYIVGGYNTSQSAEYYDFNKNIWYKLPNTKLDHDENPIIWSDHNNKNILYTMSVSSNGNAEYIDLRQSKSWIIDKTIVINPKFRDDGKIITN